LTHEQYLDEPADTVDWLLAVDRVHREVRERDDEAKWRRRIGNGSR
jgi:hypothetical protein